MSAVAVVGAGLAGLSCGAALQALGHRVQVFDKSRGPGGRCATRRSEAGPFDHGAPQFDVHDPTFGAEVQRWAAAGRIAPSASYAGDWLALPSMNALPQWLAQVGPALRCDAPVAAIEPHAAGGWSLRLQGGEVPAERHDAVVVAVPAEQAVVLLSPAPALAEALQAVVSAPCWTVMAAWPGALPLADVRFAPAEGPLALALRDDVRPQRPRQPGIAARWVLHASADWTRHNLDVPAPEVARHLLAAFERLTGARLARPRHAVAHRWRYANVPAPLTAPCGWDEAARLGACGDAWHALPGIAAASSGIERAWLSGQALAGRIGPA